MSTPTYGTYGKNDTTFNLQWITLIFIVETKREKKLMCLSLGLGIMTEDTMSVEITLTSIFKQNGKLWENFNVNINLSSNIRQE